MFGFFSSKSNHHEDLFEERITIQYQDIGGNWRDCRNVPNISAMIMTAMQDASHMNNNTRARAIDSHGRVLDIL